MTTRFVRPDERTSIDNPDKILGDVTCPGCGDVKRISLEERATAIYCMLCDTEVPIANLAEVFSAELDDDGTRFETQDGITFASLAGLLKGKREERMSGISDVVRIVFPDDSVITAVGGGWDFGYRWCWCWQGVGHEPNCKAPGQIPQSWFDGASCNGDPIEMLIAATNNDELEIDDDRCVWTGTNWMQQDAIDELLQQIDKGV
jgi:hypothetical protein